MPEAPPGFETEYAREVTDLSYKELVNLAVEGRKMGPMFYVIGGWAAWRHHQTLGSRDLDCIFPDRGIMDTFLRVYYERNGFVNMGGFLAKQMRKPVNVSGRKDPVLIEIDAASLADGPPFKEDKSVNLPFTLLEKHHEEWDLGPATVGIPTHELLILQKVKAHRDRSYDLSREADPIQVAWLRSKIWKDAHDIRGIASSGRVEWARAKAIARENKCEQLVHATLDELGITHW